MYLILYLSYKIDKQLSNDYAGFLFKRLPSRADPRTGERGRQLTRELHGAVAGTLPSIPAVPHEETVSQAGRGSRVKALVKSRLSVTRLMVLLEVCIPAIHRRCGFGVV